MKKTWKPLLTLLFSLSLLLATAASAWAAPSGMSWWSGSGNYQGWNNQWPPYGGMGGMSLSTAPGWMGGQAPGRLLYKKAGSLNQGSNKLWRGYAGSNETPMAPGWAGQQSAVQQGTSGTLRLSATPAAATGQPVELTATVFDSSGQAESGVPVTFSTTGSATFGSATVDTDANGVARTTLTDQTAENVTVTAAAIGLNVSTAVTFNAAGTAAGSIELTYSPQPATVGQQETLTATVLTSSGQAESGVPVTFSTTGSANLGSTTVDTDTDGDAQTTLTDQTAENVTVTATAAGTRTSTTLTFNAAGTAAGSIELSYGPQPAAVGQQEAVTATVLNSSGQAVVDVPVTFSVNGSATLGSTTVDTDASGVAQTTLTDAVAENVSLTAAATGVGVTVTIQF